MSEVDYDRRLSRVYRAGRALSEDTGRLWMDAIGRHLGRARSPLTVLDLGAGTGRFAALLADAFDARVIAVEPSAKMRAEAERAGGHPRVAYGDGRATDIPAPSEKSCALQAVAGLGPRRPRRSYEKSRANLTP